jgi:dienelactone hydrolase
MKLIFAAILLSASSAFAAFDPPAPEAFQVLPPVAAQAPTITDYLRYQTEMAWREDDERRRLWEGIRTEQDLRRVQEQMRSNLLKMLGELPAKKTPLNPQITGRIQMDGFHIEKLIFESLPGIYVTALVYVPNDQEKKHPAVLVPAGHSANGKAYYQALCQRLVQRGYVVICWDPVGQGERSQFWDTKNRKSRYNLICAEHAEMGNLAYLAGTNLARWEIWDGIRAVDYLLTRPDVDPDRINITGTSGGGFQTAQIAALDPRIKVAAPSCYITALPMRVYNRLFKDPDSDPEQDLYGMIAYGVDTLLMQTALAEGIKLLGICAGPDDVFLALRGLRTLSVRLAQHCKSGLEIARWLSNRPEVARVLHPALESDPGHAIWKRDFTGASGLFSIVLKPAPEKAVDALLDTVKLFGMGFSWGGFESLVIPFDCDLYRTATKWTPGGPTLRLHIGLENVDDLKADLDCGFAALKAAS